MATRKPLAEMRAVFKKSWRDSAGQYYVQFALAFREDRPIADDFFNSEWSQKPIVLQVRTLDADFKPTASDPNQPLTGTDDELARLRQYHMDTLAHMAGRKHEPVPGLDCEHDDRPGPDAQTA